MNEPGNLPAHANPCCGHVTDSSSEISRLDKFELPNVGDICVCLNCASILIYTDPEHNLTRYARRIEIETLPRETKQKLRVTQRFILKRGWLPEDARRRNGN